MKADLNMDRKTFPAIFYCPESGKPLTREGGFLVSPTGRRWPVVGGIPRFVDSDHYADSFSFEWKTHDRTQLDSFSRSTASEKTLKRKTGLDRDQVAGKLVLDAGAGAGRFTDVLLRWEAEVVAVDLSYAVEAAARNFRNCPNVTIVQADIGRLPFAPGTFDLIISIGVLHHTPDTKAYFGKLVPLLKPGGEICVWVYPDQGEYVTRTAWIPFTHRIPTRWFYDWCRIAVPFALNHFNHPVINRLIRIFPISNQTLGVENDILDTFDNYSPRYHWVHSPSEVTGWFREAGLIDIRTFPWDTAVRGRRPEA
jgi:SAM-dependent methyltransferase